MKTITITDLNQLSEFADKLPYDIEWFSKNVFRYAEDVKGIRIHITGEQFHSSMSTTLMKSVLKLQDAIYRQYSILRYGEVRRLSPEEREMLELYAKVDEGSSIVELIPKSIIDAVSKKVKDMSNGQVLAAIIIVSVAAVLCVSVPKIVDRDVKLKEMEKQAEAFDGFQKNVARAQIETIKAQTEFYREISKQKGAESVEINGETVDVEAVKKVVVAPRTKPETVQEVVAGSFKVTDIHFDDNFTSFDVADEKGLVIKDVSLLEGLITKDDYKVIKDSVDKKFMPMKIVVTKKNGKIEGAFLNSLGE